MTTLDRFLHRVAWLGSFVFVVGYAIAIPLYPGGTHFDHTHPGFDLADNYLCDAFRPRAYDGSPNVLGARVAQLAIVGFIFASSSALMAVPGRFATRRPRLARVARVTAVFGFVGMFVVLFTPSNEYDQLHFAVVGVAAVPALGSMLAVSVGVLGEADAESPLGSYVRTLTILMLVGSALHVAQYAAEATHLVEANVWVPRLQKVVVLIMVAWIPTVARWSVIDVDSRLRSASSPRDRATNAADLTANGTR